jgi:hypothetical protein
LSCLFSPPLEERPEELDVPPEFDFEDITPNPRRTVRLNRADAEPVEFGITEVRDRNVDDEIQFRYEVDLGNGVVIAPSGGTGRLEVDSVASALQGLTVYEPVLLSLNPCLEELRLADAVTVSLTLTDALPPSQVDVVNRRFEHVISVVWSVRFDDQCPVTLTGS